MAEQNRPDGRELDEMAERDHKIAGDAARDAEVEQSAAAGNPHHPHPDIANADHIRAQDDLRTFGRQQDLAERSADAARTLSASAEQLRENRERLEQVRHDAHERTGELQALASDARDLREQTRQAAEQVRSVEPPDVDR